MARGSQIFFDFFSAGRGLVVRHLHGHRVFGVANVTVVWRIPDGIDEQRRRRQRD